MRLEPVLKHYWILIVVVMGLLIADVGVTAVLVYTENPTTKSVSNDEPVILDDGSGLKANKSIPFLRPKVGAAVGNHTEWDKEPSKILKTTESLMIPLAYAFLITCAGGLGLKIYHEKKGQV